MIDLIILAAIPAGLSNWIDDCIAPDMIWARYGNWVRGLGFWGKPIGGCLICTNTWVTLIWMGFVCHKDIHSLSDLVFRAILFIAVSNTALKFIIR
jgi:hypothetical protein